MHPQSLASFLLAGSLLAACGKPVTEAPTANAGPPTISVAPFSELAQFPERDAPATVLGKNETRLAAEVAARVLRIHADSGDIVKAGQVLVSLDARDAELGLARAEAGLAQAQARLALAEAQMTRSQRLREQNFISAEAVNLRDTELAAARADVQSARATRDTARHGVEKCRVTAPFTGIVRNRSVQLGELAAPGTPLFTLTDTGELQVVAQVQARESESLAGATEVSFVSDSGRYPLQRLSISAAVSRESRTVEARYRFTGAAPAPGSEGRLIWRDPRPHLAAEYILRRDSRQGVFAIEADKARFIALPQAQEGRPASADFAPDTRLAVRGRHALQDGMTVTVQAAAK